MAPIVTCAEIARPAEEVFAYATDPARPGPARFSEWRKGVLDGQGHQALAGLYLRRKVGARI
jgi:hypothetical protein